METARVSRLLMAVVGVVVLLAFAQCSNGAQYKVGGDQGWVLGGPNYAAWARQHQFKAGDTLLFHYSAETHSVLQVSQQDFKSCSTSRPVLTATGGNNVIRLSRGGTYWFICGVAEHCAAGMKIAIQASGPNLTPDELSLSPSHDDYLNAYPASTEDQP